MRLLLRNHVHDTQATISGDSMMVERRLRNLFPDVVESVPVGDLRSVLSEIGRLYGVTLELLDGEIPDPHPAWQDPNYPVAMPTIEDLANKIDPPHKAYKAQLGDWLGKSELAKSHKINLKGTPAPPAPKIVGDHPRHHFSHVVHGDVANPEAETGVAYDFTNRLHPDDQKAGHKMILVAPGKDSQLKRLHVIATGPTNPEEAFGVDPHRMCAFNTDYKTATSHLGTTIVGDHPYHKDIMKNEQLLIWDWIRMHHPDEQAEHVASCPDCGAQAYSQLDINHIQDPNDPAMFYAKAEKKPKDSPLHHRTVEGGIAVYDYSHKLPPEAQKAGYRISIAGPADGQGDLHLAVDDPQDQVFARYHLWKQHGSINENSNNDRAAVLKHLEPFGMDFPAADKMCVSTLKEIASGLKPQEQARHVQSCEHCRARIQSQFTLDSRPAEEIGEDYYAKSEVPWLTRESFIAKYSKKLLDKLASACAVWIAYKDGIDEALETLIANRAALADVMDLAVKTDLYRGVAVDIDSYLAAAMVDDPVQFKQLKPAESWTTSERIARSFAAASDWHQYDPPPVGIVVRMSKEDANKRDILLAPPAQTARWFEAEIKAELTKKIKADRAVEREFLIVGKAMSAVLVDKFFTETKKSESNLLTKGELEIALEQAGVASWSQSYFRAAQFLSGRESPALDSFRKALQLEEGDVEAAALSAYGLAVTPKAREQLRAVLDLDSLQKDEPEINMACKVESGNPDADETAQAVQRAFDAGKVQQVQLGGKHSAGSMVCKDPETRQAFLLKPGSGDQSPAAGAREEESSQAQREACWWHVMQVCGVEDSYPRSDLLRLDGKPVASLELLPTTYKNLGVKRQKEPNLLPGALEPYRQRGLIHKWAVMDFVFGNPDRHSQNVMISADNRDVRLIDHGSAFAGPSFDPAGDPDSYIPYYLRAWTVKKFTDMDPEEKVQKMPRVPSLVEQELRKWLDSIDENRIQLTLESYGINPQPSLERLEELRMLAAEGPVDLQINRLWAGEA
jgi:hypothetical protein